MIKSVARRTSSLQRDWVYDLAEGLDLRMVVDVGAGAAHFTRKLRLLGGDDTRVIAFEPFPGNLPHFTEATKDLDGITLIHKAVSDRVGRSLLHVHSTVTGDEPGWEQFEGYSSVGRLLPTRKLDWLTYRWNRQDGEILRVKTTTLDKELGGHRVDFLKVDVQGSEHLVLAGAARLLSEQRIRLMCVEWMGDPRVSEPLIENGYEIYDSHYVAVGDRGVFEGHGFQLVGELSLSTGRAAWEMIYLGSDDVTGVLQGLNARSELMVQTDLVAMPESDLELAGVLSGMLD